MCDALRELFSDELREGEEKGVAEGMVEGEAYNVPIDVDTLRRRVP